ncbi:hypothetical protein HPO_16830 [Hyphomonas polymorpha PS728]|uniref:Uncharacterized protein n=1 Tax=Hyphomonas polymorpha PS728 TaxID=1280954 RepID=A0A062VG97_9PROT|nr:hypothetical protein HPO_16830 [Hyphomonas polymorpha PS728]
MPHRKRPDFRQHLLKSAIRTAGAKVVPSEFFDEFLIAVYDPYAALYAGFGVEALAPFRGDLERTEVHQMI